MKPNPYYKIVLMPIQVTQDDYCLGGPPLRRICGHLDTEGGHLTCDFKLDELEHLKYEKNGTVKKPKKCLELQEPCYESPIMGINNTDSKVKEIEQKIGELEQMAMDLVRSISLHQCQLIVSVFKEVGAKYNFMEPGTNYTYIEACNDIYDAIEELRHSNIEEITKRILRRGHV
jgi:hypothetical protein